METYIIKTKWTMEHVAKGRFAIPATKELKIRFKPPAEAVQQEQFVSQAAHRVTLS